METILDALRTIIGSPDFYIESSGYSGTWDYGAMIEYFVASAVLLVVVASVFRFLGKLVSR